MRFAVFLTCILSVALASCEFQKQADMKFGDQHFKTAISLIELHRVRFGTYPGSLSDLKYIGDWDRIALASVAYRRLDSGYELNVIKGWTSQPQLQYKSEFWQGLGLIRSNVKSVRDSTVQ